MQEKNALSANEYLVSLLSLDKEELQCRRDLLTSHFDDLASKGKDCSQCEGFCCTYEYNSMRVTPLEALELYCDLNRKSFFTKDFILDLKENIKKYRLSYDIEDGRGRILRRYYTCPLFMNKSLGCPVDPNSKPLGCLGFYPKVENVSQRDLCSSDESRLSSIQDSYSQEILKLNNQIAKDLNLSWEKQTIPVALLDIFSFFS